MSHCWKSCVDVTYISLSSECSLNLELISSFQIIYLYGPTFYFEINTGLVILLFQLMLSTKKIKSTHEIDF